MSNRSVSHLPTEIDQPCGKSELFMTIAGALILTLLVNCGVLEYLKKNTSNLGYYLIRDKWEKLLHLDKPADWLILGDSSGNQGFDPEILTQYFNGSGLNLCTIGDLLLVNDAWMLQTHIERSGRPGNVILIHVYDVYCREFNASAMGQIPLAYGFWNGLNPRVPLGKQQWLRYLLSRYFPLYSQETAVSNLLNPLRSKQTFRIRDNGFMPSFLPDPFLVKEDVKMHLAFLEAHSFEISRPNRDALEAMALLAEKYEFNIYLSASPIASNLAENQVFRSYFQEEVDFLKEFCRRYPHMRVLFEKAPGFPGLGMQNADHLASREDVERYSTLVCEAITAKN
jgi:hypothetical protein